MYFFLSSQYSFSFLLLRSKIPQMQIKISLLFFKNKNSEPYFSIQTFLEASVVVGKDFFVCLFTCLFVRLMKQKKEEK